MKRPAFVGFSSEESEVAEQTPLEKRKLQVLLLLIQFVHCARLRSPSLDRQRTEFNLFGILFLRFVSLDPVVAVMELSST
jgi:hypothetical protein